MQPKDKHTRYLRDFLKIGRIGKVFKLFGAPDEFEGPYSSHQEAEAAMNQILNSPEDFQVRKRKVVRITQKEGE